MILPVNNQRFVEKSWQRGADAITLDLEDSISPLEKDSARALVRDAIAIAGKGGADVIVRINNEPDRIEGDLEASVYPGLAGLAIPKVESAEQLRWIEAVVSRLEQERGIAPGTIKTTLSFETAKGLLHMTEAVAAATRAESMGVGTEDFTCDIGMELTDPQMLYYPKFYGLIVARAFGLHPRGMIGSISNYRDIEGMRHVARKAYQYGFRGDACIHPDQVKVLNEAFSPDPLKVEYARKVAAAYEEGVAAGKGSVGVDGKMVDFPVYMRAKEVLDIQERIDRREAEHRAKLAAAWQSTAAV